MHRELQLLRRALADPDFATVDARADFDSDYFQYYSVRLPPTKYRGFPPVWDFAILKRIEHSADLETVVKDAEALVQRTMQREKKDTHLVILSDEPRFILYDELLFADYLVFCLDARDLPSISKLPSQSHLAPLSLAIRRTLKSNELLSLFLNPYIRNKPAIGWRFYGRKKELDQLISSDENIIIVGGRRIGKTSLMREAHQRLITMKQSSYFISAEACKTAGDVVKDLATAIATRDYEAALRRSRALDEKLLVSLLRRISSQSSPPTIFIDELGNVIANRHSGDDWGFLGILRQFSQSGRLRIIFSCFQEAFLSQAQEFEGPLVNFGTTMRLSVFSEAEVEDLLFAPLELWRPAGEDRKAIRDLVLTGVGRHPLLLQYFCHALFERVAVGGERRLLEDAQRILGRDLGDCFGNAVNEVFWKAATPLLSYLFLRHCVEAGAAKKALSIAELSDEWIVGVLRALGLEAGIFETRTILEALEVRGWTHRAEHSDGERQIVSSPVIFKYLKMAERDLATTISRLRSETPKEAERWKLSRRASE